MRTLTDLYQNKWARFAKVIYVFAYFIAIAFWLFEVFFIFF